MSSVRIAIVGMGLIGRQHASRVQSNPDSELSAVVDATVDTVHLASQWRCPAYSNLDALLATESVDAVIIATPNPLHVEQAQQCLAAGMTVLIEKPLAESLESAQSLVDWANLNGCVNRCLVGHHRVHSALLSKAIEVINEGHLGRLVAIQGSALFAKPAQYFVDSPWRTEPESGGPILINLIHEIGNFRALVGEIAEVSALTSSETRGYEVEDSLSLAIRFKNGAMGSFLLSDCAASTQSWEQTSGENLSYFHDPVAPCYHIAGTQGSLTVPSLTLTTFGQGIEPSWWNTPNQQRLAHSKNDPLDAQLAHLIDLVRGNSAPRVSLNDGLANMQVIEAISQSIKTQRPCTL